MARDAYAYLYLPMIAGVILFSIGNEEILHKITDPAGGIAEKVDGPAVPMLFGVWSGTSPSTCCFNCVPSAPSAGPASASSWCSWRPSGRSAPAGAGHAHPRDSDLRGAGGRGGDGDVEVPARATGRRLRGADQPRGPRGRLACALARRPGDRRADHTVTRPSRFRPPPPAG
ncbi:hypothetical protein NKG94_46815 [Micromonospora sp. M12]